METPLIDDARKPEGTQPRKGSWLDLPLRLVSDVKPGEGPQALALLASVFMLLFSYYVLKTVREPLILATGGADMKSYGSAAQAASLLVFVPVYSWFAAKVGRLKLVLGTGLFFVVCLELFYLCAQWGVPNLGFIFYVWLGIFSVSSIAQFWSFANDLYNKEAGERLFAIIGVGATLGGALGASFAKTRFEQHTDAYNMMHVAVGLLIVYMGVMTWIHRRAPAAPQPTQPQAQESPWAGASAGFGLIFRSRYLFLIALVLLLLNWVNTNGEWILSNAIDNVVLDELRAQGANVDDQTLRKHPEYKPLVGQFWGGFFEWVNYLTLAFQVLLVSRLVKYGGLRVVVLMLPLVSLGAYSAIAVGASLGFIRVLKMCENATDYSIMNTAKAMLWLPTTVAEKYSAKQTADTFFVRLGDVFSFVVITQVGIKGWPLAVLNLVLVAGWLTASVWLLRTQPSQKTS